MTKLFFTPISNTQMVNKSGDVWTAKPNTKAAEKIKYSFKQEILVSVKMDDEGEAIFGTASSGNITSWSQPLPDTKFKAAKAEVVDLPKEQVALMDFIKTSVDLKPEVLKMQPLKWKYLMRSAARGKNIMMTGPAGCGKTMAAKSVSEVLDRPSFYFNLGATQDPRSTLIGNTHFNKQDGTFFSEALFVKAIQTEDAVILLDELSRAHPDAHNILMTVLDEGQRYLRLDEADDSPTIEVAKGVTFIATANIGNEYTSTRVIDRALLDRFTIIEMDLLSKEKEEALLLQMYPEADKAMISNIASIVSATREEMKTEIPRISTSVSTRASVEFASLCYDGFSLEEAASVTVYPLYDDAGGLDSERTFIKQLVQKFIPANTDENIFNTESDELFTEEDINTAS